MSTWFAVARAAFLKHLAYLGALMANSAGSCLLGLVYIALRHAATQGRTLGPFPAQEMESYIALSQAVLWVSVFLPSGLDIRHQIRTGSVALEMARPAPYVPRMVASGVGEALYNLMFRSGPLIICFTIRGVFPWADIATVPHALLLGAIWGRPADRGAVGRGDTGLGVGSHSTHSGGGPFRASAFGEPAWSPGARTPRRTGRAPFTHPAPRFLAVTPPDGAPGARAA